MNIDRAPGAVSKKGRMPITCTSICTTNTYNGKKRVILISNLSNSHRERRLEALYSSGTYFQIISVSDEGYHLLA